MSISEKLKWCSKEKFLFYLGKSIFFTYYILFMSITLRINGATTVKNFNKMRVRYLFEC